MRKKIEKNMEKINDSHNGGNNASDDSDTGICSE